MARSQYIYLVVGDSNPLAAFTVKHELRTWLARQERGAVWVSMRVLRIRDGGAAWWLSDDPEAMKDITEEFQW